MQQLPASTWCDTPWTVVSAVELCARHLASARQNSTPPKIGSSEPSAFWGVGARLPASTTTATAFRCLAAFGRARGPCWRYVLEMICLTAKSAKCPRSSCAWAYCATVSVLTVGWNGMVPNGRTDLRFHADDNATPVARPAHPSRSNHPPTPGEGLSRLVSSSSLRSTSAGGFIMTNPASINVPGWTPPCAVAAIRYARTPPSQLKNASHSCTAPSPRWKSIGAPPTVSVLTLSGGSQNKWLSANHLGSRR